MAKHALDTLFETIVSRKGGDPESSYTARLFSRGRKKIVQKLGEEAVETVIAALSESDDHLVSESADLLYHLAVVWADRGVSPQKIWDELARRQGVSGIDEKKSRQK